MFTRLTLTFPYATPQVHNMKKTYHLVGRYGWPRGALEFWNQLEGSFLRWNKIEALLCDRPPKSWGWRERGAQQPPLLGPLTNATLLRKRRNIKNWREEIDKYKTKKKLYAQIPLHSALETFSLSSSKCTSRKKAYWKNIFPAYDHCQPSLGCELHCAPLYRTLSNPFPRFMQVQLCAL